MASATPDLVVAALEGCLRPLDHVAVGADETSEFVRQSRLMWDAWPRNRPAGMRGILVIPQRHHFNVVLDYTDSASALTQATLALFAARA